MRYRYLAGTPRNYAGFASNHQLLCDRQAAILDEKGHRINRTIHFSREAFRTRLGSSSNYFSFPCSRYDTFEVEWLEPPSNALPDTTHVYYSWRYPTSNWIRDIRTHGFRPYFNAIETRVRGETRKALINGARVELIKLLHGESELNLWLGVEGLETLDSLQGALRSVHDRLIEEIPAMVDDGYSDGDRVLPRTLNMLKSKIANWRRLVGVEDLGRVPNFLRKGYLSYVLEIAPSLEAFATLMSFSKYIEERIAHLLFFSRPRRAVSSFRRYWTREQLVLDVFLPLSPFYSQIGLIREWDNLLFHDPIFIEGREYGDSRFKWRYTPIVHALSGISCTARVGGTVTLRSPYLERNDWVGYTVASLAEVFGFHKPAALVWQAIPFSFVFNWFVDVESFLGEVFHVPYVQDATITNPWYSFSETALFCRTWKVPPPGGIPQNWRPGPTRRSKPDEAKIAKYLAEFAPLGSKEIPSWDSSFLPQNREEWEPAFGERIYMRERGLPPPLSLSFYPSLSPSKVATLLALVASKGD